MVREFKADAGWVRGVISYAYDVLGSQVLGGPGWVDSDRYDFLAKTDRVDVSREQIKEMLRTLLAERFKLVVHRETRQLPSYTLVIGKTGSKMEESKEGRKNYVNWRGRGLVDFTECSMLCLINVLSNTLGSPVIDRTGLKGQYTFSLEFSDSMRAGKDAELPADAPPDLLRAVQDQLGLKLEAKRGPVEVVVIDHIEPASEN